MSSTIAFAGSRHLASGALTDVALAAKHAIEAGEAAPILIFDAATSQPVEIDFRGDEADMRRRLAPSNPAMDEPIPARGRPKLGVIAREVTLLPRHWDWLARQRSGASATLRRLVEEARLADTAGNATREGREALYRFITVMAGNAQGYEEATRALFAGDEARFQAESAGWPRDVRDHASTLARAAFGVAD